MEETESVLYSQHSNRGRSVAGVRRALGLESNTPAISDLGNAFASMDLQRRLEKKVAKHRSELVDFLKKQDDALMDIVSKFSDAEGKACSCQSPGQVAVQKGHPSENGNKHRHDDEHSFCDEFEENPFHEEHIITPRARPSAIGKGSPSRKYFNFGNFDSVGEELSPLDRKLSDKSSSLENEDVTECSGRASKKKVSFARKATDDDDLQCSGKLQSYQSGRSPVSCQSTTASDDSSNRIFNSLEMILAGQSRMERTLDSFFTSTAKRFGSALDRRSHGAFASNASITSSANISHMKMRSSLSSTESLMNTQNLGDRNGKFKVSSFPSIGVTNGRTRSPSYIQRTLDMALDRTELPPNLLIRRILISLVRNRYFELLSGLLIFANVFFIAYEAEYESKLDAMDRKELFERVHLIFNAVFFVELITRFGATGKMFFVGPDWKWHLFDAIVVFIGILDFFLAWLSLKFSLGHTRSLRILRMFRLTRTIRLARTMKSSREFQKMMYGVMASMRTLVCSSLILGFVMYFFAIIFTSRATEARKLARPPAGGTEWPLDTYYGNFGRTYTSLFLAISEGISWHEVYNPIKDDLDWVHATLFIMYVAIVIFGVLNVITAVFVESAILSAKHYRDLIEQDKEHDKDIAMKHMKAVFNQIDTDCSGQISSDEMEYFLSEPSLRQYLEALDINIEDTRMLFRLLDQDNSGVIDIDEFCNGCLRLKGEAKSIDVHTLLFKVKQFLRQWSDFTVYVEETFEVHQRHLMRKSLPKVDERHIR